MPRVGIEPLRSFVVEVLEKLGTPREHAEITADVLILSDRRDIPSHGVARLGRYVKDIQAGTIDPKATHAIIKETPTTLLVEGNAGLGQVIAKRVMELVIDKAKKYGMAAASVRNSNHYGIAGYYAKMALEKDLIGISITNSAPLMVPTFGRTVILGTNPVAFAVPTGKERPFFFDGATTTVPRGKLEVYARLKKEIPLSWATDETGSPTSDPVRVLKNMIERTGGGLAPLGGSGEEGAGYKGYDMSAILDILSGALSLGTVGTEVYGTKGAPPGVCHFLAAIDPLAFVDDLNAFKSRMDSFIQMMRNAPRQEGAERIWIAGEKEWLAEERNNTDVPLDEPTVEELKKMGAELGVEFSM